MAMSANGLIARDNDETEWSSEESDSYIAKVKEIGNMVIGRRTYELMLEDDNKDASTQNLGNPMIVVLTSDDKYKDTEKVRFVKNPIEAISLLGKEGFERMVVVGGGKTDTSFIKNGLIDEIYLDVEPVIFGQGIPLFAPEKFEYKLKLLETKKLSPNTVQLHYEVIK